MTVLTANELRALLLQTAAYQNAMAILNDEWGSRVQENPLYQAPISIADLQFVAHLQATGIHRPVLDFTDYSAVSEWIITHQAALTPNVIAWLRRPFD
ncbi:hypothetical protein [Levilactobacillus suantsaii]|uniref:Uncharacterized protein n=1 Tax=Levilactobacillus suantsaii TaxID=2292255 RepID=A0A4Q0VIQ1_9LACO|nr:hypothetical protein [Levilactobacillus suantsaii]RXI79371.1 hypothetical protein DXH47_03050 [Levilactobacillus suantsaii]